ncbi:ATP-dependent RNA helicase DBP2-A [Cyclospora cayetanensis]|uniref:ATP-dependent RNA helicase DBP2-A n=1 Tax=Cyclospora cayetanensis TaxID=88456 RepID=A0A6P6RTX5_9EIME|nr:ATP-dependent RNA helicase DBP2-A [Cyclospora cayetanensis]
MPRARGPPPALEGVFLTSNKPWQRDFLQGQPEQQDWRQVSQELQQGSQDQSAVSHGTFMPPDDPWYSTPSSAFASAPPTPPSPRQPRQKEQESHWRPSAQKTAAEGGRRLAEGGAGCGLRPIDWDRQNLPPIHPVSELPVDSDAEGGAAAALAAEEMQRLGITVEGLPPLPRLVPSFEAAGISPTLVQALLSLSLVSPSPIQRIGWPCCFSGRDVIAVSQTGSGKTLGFLIPALMHIQQQQQRSEGEGRRAASQQAGVPTVLVLAPTRELVVQINTESQRILRAAAASSKTEGLGDVSAAPKGASGKAAAAAALARSVAIYGGASRPQQILQLKLGADIVVATPGR